MKFGIIFLAAAAAGVTGMVIGERSIEEVERRNNLGDATYLKPIKPGKLRRDGLSGLDTRQQDSFLYGDSRDGRTHILANVTVVLNDGRELVSMERFEGMTKRVECDETMELEFVSKEAFEYAIHAWNWVNENADDSFVMIANHEGCGPNDERVPYNIYDVDYDEKKFIAHLKGTQMQWSDLDGDLTIEYGKNVVPSQPAKRGLGDIWDKATNWADVSKDESIVFDMSKDLDGTNLWSSSVGNLDLSLDCVDCGTSGNFQIQGRIKVNPAQLDVKELSVQAVPQNFEARLGLSLTASGTVKEFSQTKNLVQVPLPGSIAISGIFKLGASFDYDVGLTATAEGQATVSYGLIARIPNTAILKIDVRNPGSSEFSGWTPEFEEIPFKVDASLSGNVAIYSQPGLSLGFSVLDKWGYEAQLAMRLPQLSTEFVVKADSAGVCGGADKAGVEVEANIGVSMFFRVGEDKATNADSLFRKDFFTYDKPLLSKCFGIAGTVGEGDGNVNVNEDANKNTAKTPSNPTSKETPKEPAPETTPPAPETTPPAAETTPPALETTPPPAKTTPPAGTEPTEASPSKSPSSDVDLNPSSGVNKGVSSESGSTTADPSSSQAASSTQDSESLTSSASSASSIPSESSASLDLSSSDLAQSSGSPAKTGDAVSQSDASATSSPSATDSASASDLVSASNSASATTSVSSTTGSDVSSSTGSASASITPSPSRVCKRPSKSAGNRNVPRTAAAQQDPDASSSSDEEAEDGEACELEPAHTTTLSCYPWAAEKNYRGRPTQPRRRSLIARGSKDPVKISGCSSRSLEITFPNYPSPRDVIARTSQYSAIKKWFDNTNDKGCSDWGIDFGGAYMVDGNVATPHYETEHVYEANFIPSFLKHLTSSIGCNAVEQLFFHDQLPDGVDQGPRADKTPGISLITEQIGSNTNLDRLTMLEGHINNLKFDVLKDKGNIFRTNNWNRELHLEGQFTKLRQVAACASYLAHEKVDEIMMETKWAIEEQLDAIEDEAGTDHGLSTLHHEWFVKKYQESNKRIEKFVKGALKSIKANKDWNMVKGRHPDLVKYLKEVESGAQKPQELPTPRERGT